MSTQEILDSLNAAEEGLDMEGSGIPMNMEGMKMPTKEDLLEMLDGLGLSEDEANEIRAALTGEGELPLAGMIKENPWTSQAFVLLAFLLLVSSIFILIGYRLYKSMADRETQREEKKQQKMLRKKRT